MPTTAQKAKLSARAQDSYLRAKRERPSIGLLSNKQPEPTLDEARQDLAQVISRLTHQLFADRFGPLVGTITETTITAALKNFEVQLTKAKGDITLVVQELADRVISSPRKSNLKGK